MGLADEFDGVAHAIAPMLHRTAWLLTTDAHASEDLVQEALARLYVALRSRKHVDNPPAYARTVLVRLYIDQRRRRWSREVVTDCVPETTVGDDRAGGLSLWSALDGLSRDDRAVLVLRYYYDLSASEVAGELQTTEAAVRTRASRAAARVRKVLGPDFVVDRRMS